MAEVHGTRHSPLHLNPIALTFSLFTPLPSVVVMETDSQLGFAHSFSPCAIFPERPAYKPISDVREQPSNHRGGAILQIPAITAPGNVPGLTENNAGDAGRARPRRRRVDRGGYYHTQADVRGSQMTG